MRSRSCKTCISLAAIITCVILVANYLEIIISPRIKDGDSGCGFHQNFQVFIPLRPGVSPILSVLIRFAKVRNLTVTRHSDHVIQVRSGPLVTIGLDAGKRDGSPSECSSKQEPIQIAILSNPVRTFVHLHRQLSSKKLRQTLDNMSDGEIRQRMESYSVFSLLGVPPIQNQTFDDVRRFIRHIESEYEVFGVDDLVEDSLLVLRFCLGLSYVDITCVAHHNYRIAPPNLTVRQMKRLKKVLWREVIVYKHFSQKLKTLSRQITTTENVMKFQQYKSDLRHLRSIITREHSLSGTQSICLEDLTSHTET